MGTGQKSTIRWFIFFLAAFYAAWIAIVITGNHWSDLAAHWEIAIAMLAGSYVSGSTPMGGGTVGFPILVLLMDQPATLGRDFSFAVQAIGMTSAAVYIFCTRTPLERPMLAAAVIGSVVGTPLGILYVAPLVSGVAIKLLFAVIWGSFGLFHLLRIGEITRFEGITNNTMTFDVTAGLIIGFLGGLLVASITGVGIDMLLYMTLVLLCRADIKIAIATSVVLMAATSVVGIGTKMLAGSMAPGVFGHWLAAAPIVALGAPFGAMIVRRIGRRMTLLIVSILCVAQYLWTLSREWEHLSTPQLKVGLLGMIVFLLTFEALYRFGSDRRAVEKVSMRERNPQ